MASVTSLDQDMRNLRLSRYTPQAANEVRQWIEETVGHPLAAGDLLNALRDGVALCELANLARPPPGIKFKKSAMPFIQMENISHFLKACEMPPLNLQAHDRFLTVDLFEAKDPAQVLQCLSSFSRQAHAANPSRFRSTIGPKKANPLSPSGTGTVSSNTSSWRGNSYSGSQTSNSTRPSMAISSSSGRAMSPALTGGSTGSQNSAKSPQGGVSSWSKKTDESNTTPAWNIHQYGYMGGASQGNQGISFGARRQITSQAPQVPGLAEKERQRREKQAEEQRTRQQADEAEHKRRTEREAEEEREKIEEERRWEEETRRMREEERKRVEEQKRQWEEQEQQWKVEEEIRRKEAVHLKSMMSTKLPPETPRTASGSVMRGQTLMQYQRDQAALEAKSNGQSETPEMARVRELEKQLEEARERERQYQAEREERIRLGKDWSRPSTAQTERPQTAQSADQSEVSWAGADEREYLRKQWQSNQPPASEPQLQKEAPQPPPSMPSRPLPEPTVEDSEPETGAEEEEAPALPTHAPQGLPRDLSSASIPHFTDSAPASSPLGSANRPLPEPKAYTPYTPTQPKTSRTSAFLATNTPPSDPAPRISASKETGDTSLEQSAARDRRNASQATTKAGGWASKSLLEREMERERERQREWENEQKVTQERKRDPNEGTGAGQSWDVNQYGYTGGDSQNRGSSSGSGIGFGARRQILGPRPKP